MKEMAIDRRHDRKEMRQILADLRQISLDNAVVLRRIDEKLDDES